MTNGSTNQLNLSIYSAEAEQTILGAVLLKPEALDEIAWLENRDFFLDRHKILIEYFRYLYENGKPLDMVHIAEELKRFGKLDSVGGVGYIVELQRAAISASNVTYYADIVRKKAIRRRGVELAEKIKELSEDDSIDTDDYFHEIEKRTDELRPKQIGQLQHISKTRDEFFAHMETEDDFVKTGFPAFDEWGGGIARKALIIVAGRPSAGKTAKSLQMALGLASKAEGAGAIFSQEMDTNQVKARMLACSSGINYTRIRRKWLMQDLSERAQLEQAYDKIEKLPLYIRDSSGLTIQEIRADVRRLKREKGKIAFIIVDYLTLLKITVPKGSSYAKEVGNVCWAAKLMAKEFDCPFIMLAQMSREGEKAEEPKLAHLKESGDIEQHADMVEFLWVNAKDEENRAGKIVTSTIAKGRDTGTRTFKYLFRGAFQRFEDYAEKENKK